MSIIYPVILHYYPWNTQLGCSFLQAKIHIRNESVCLTMYYNFKRWHTFPSATLNNKYDCYCNRTEACCLANREHSQFTNITSTSLEHGNLLLFPVSKLSFLYLFLFLKFYLNNLHTNAVTDSKWVEKQQPPYKQQLVGKVRNQYSEESETTLLRGF